MERFTLEVIDQGDRVFVRISGQQYGYVPVACVYKKGDAVGEELVARLLMHSAAQVWKVRD